MPKLVYRVSKQLSRKPSPRPTACAEKGRRERVAIKAASQPSVGRPPA